jgi:hypothetical protein
MRMKAIVVVALQSWLVAAGATVDRRFARCLAARASRVGSRNSNSKLQMPTLMYG